MSKQQFDFQRLEGETQPCHPDLLLWCLWAAPNLLPLLPTAPLSPCSTFPWVWYHPPPWWRLFSFSSTSAFILNCSFQQPDQFSSTSCCQHQRFSCSVLVSPLFSPFLALPWGPLYLSIQKKLRILHIFKYDCSYFISFPKSAKKLRKFPHIFPEI